MRFARLPLSFLLPLIPVLIPVHAQDQNSSYIQDCVSALQSAGFTGLANAITQINGTEPAQALFSELSSGKNYTLFAPVNDAVQSIPSQISGNTTLLAEYVSYHFVSGNFVNSSWTNTSSAGGSGGGGTSSSTSVFSSTESSSSSSESSSSSSGSYSSSLAGTSTITATTSPTAALYKRPQGRQGSNSTGSYPQPYSGIWPNVTIGRTLLNASELVNLPGNKSQVLVWTRSWENGNVTILNQANGTTSRNVTVVYGTIWNNLFINGISGYLIPPDSFNTALTAVGASAAQSWLSSVEVPALNGTNLTALQDLQSAKGFTFFIPNNDAFTSTLNQTIQGLSNNQTALVDLLQNHYINGTSLYSTEIENNSNVTNAAGEPLQFTRNDTGLFVSGANGSSAQIVRPDVLLQNGVGHIINQALFVTDADPSAASQAYQSATSAAATMTTTETGPIGIIGGGGQTTTATPSSSSSSASSSTSTSSSSTSSSSSSASSSSSSTSTSSSFSSTSPTSTQPSGSGTSSSPGGTVTVTATSRTKSTVYNSASGSPGVSGIVCSMIISIVAGACLLV